MDQIRLPAPLRFWIEQFQREGEQESAAIRHAIDRCYESGDISEAQAERYETLLLSKF